MKENNVVAQYCSSDRTCSMMELVWLVKRLAEDQQKEQVVRRPGFEPGSLPSLT
jgi:hypothetical protein